MKDSSVFGAVFANKWAMRGCAHGLILSLLAQFTACGTILYPERKGTISGQIDPAVAIMDGLGLLLFFIPGVIAFAVDFTNGTIYLPRGKRSHLSQQELQSIRKNDRVDLQELNQLLSAKLGQTIDVRAQGVRVRNSQSEDAVLADLNSHPLSLAARY